VSVGSEKVAGEPSESDLQHSPLDAQHRALEAKMVPFGGWDMPLQYTGVLDEHRACRENAVVFDVSHLGQLPMRGRGVFDLLQRLFTNDLARIGPGRAQYTHLLDPDDAHVVDDIIVWWVAEDEFIVMPNASNTQRLVDAISEDRRGGGDDVELLGREAGGALLAVQGPKSRRVLALVSAEAADVARFTVGKVVWHDTTVIVAGTGYTGEDGVEVLVADDHAAAFWAALLEAGASPAGLGARDTLRLEAGLPLHGHELGPGITPLQAGLGWVVRWDKGDFRGRAALEAERERGIGRRLRGIAINGRRPAREGAHVLLDGVDVGTVTSGNFSPTLGNAIALALLRPDIGSGAPVQLDVRGQLLDGQVVELPFVKR
jgi:aminomethyltransferase